MSQELVEMIIKIIITLIGLLFTMVIIPWIKTNIDKNKFENLQVYVEYAVRCAEQMYKLNQSKEKKQYVYAYILDKASKMGLSLDERDIDILVEGVVNYVKYGGE